MARRFLKTCIAAALTAMIGTATAGPVIIDGTDSADHGSAGAGGWLYMQKALESLGSAVNPLAAKVVTVLGVDGTVSTQARNAIQSAFGASALSGTWTLNFVDGAAAIGTYLSTLSTSNTGILYLGTAGEVGGDMDATELAAVTANAAAINSFVSGAGNPSLGGALWSQAESVTGAYGWLTTLIPGIVATDLGAGGIGTPLSLTAAGNTAFPGLTNADLSTGPWHGGFSGNLGGLSVLATGLDANTTRNVIIGGGAGTVIQGAPEPDSLALLGLGLAAAFAVRRRKTS